MPWGDRDAVPGAGAVGLRCRANPRWRPRDDRDDDLRERDGREQRHGNGRVRRAGARVQEDGREPPEREERAPPRERCERAQNRERPDDREQRLGRSEAEERELRERLRARVCVLNPVPPVARAAMNGSNPWADATVAHHGAVSRAVPNAMTTDAMMPNRCRPKKTRNSAALNATKGAVPRWLSTVSAEKT